MITGLEYVLAAYGIWLIIFIIYIFLNKKHIKYLKKSIEAFEKKNSHSNKEL